MPLTRHRTDHLNSALILLSGVAAWYLPLPLFLLAYALLGPLHYLTEIAWLRQRNYYLKRPSFGVFMIVLVAFAIGWQLLTGQALHSLMFISFMLVVIIQSPLPKWAQLLLGLMVTLAGPLVSQLPWIDLLFAMLLPTLIHVAVFTWLFMLQGSISRQSQAGYFSCFLYIATFIGLFLVPANALQRLPGHLLDHAAGFIPLAETLVQISNRTLSSDTLQAAFRVMAFAYTYHYLNWFSKVRIIQWHRLPQAQLAVIGVLWIGAIGLYVMDFQTGLAALLGLSVLHVVLEFPLNLKVITELGRLPLHHFTQLKDRQTAS